MRDITYCVADCSRKDCDRHYGRIPRLQFAVSLSDFSESCRNYKPEEEKNERINKARGRSRYDDKGVG